MLGSTGLFFGTANALFSAPVDDAPAFSASKSAFVFGDSGSRSVENASFGLLASSVDL